LPIVQCRGHGVGGKTIPTDLLEELLIGVEERPWNRESKDRKSRQRRSDENLIGDAKANN
jgi:hypothetical protein